MREVKGSFGGVLDSSEAGPCAEECTCGPGWNDALDAELNRSAMLVEVVELTKCVSKRALLPVGQRRPRGAQAKEKTRFRSVTQEREGMM